MIALSIQLGALVEPGNFPNDQESHFLLGLRVNVGVVGEVVLALENAIEVFPVVAVAQKRGASCKQRDDVLVIVFAEVKRRGGRHSEEEGERNEKKKKQILEVFNLAGGAVRLAIQEHLTKICFRMSE